jgi:hypothetical protein
MPDRETYLGPPGWGWAWRWHSHPVESQMSRNLGKGKAMVRKWSRSAREEECSVKQRVMMNWSHNVNFNDSSTKVYLSIQFKTPSTTSRTMLITD